MPHPTIPELNVHVEYRHYAVHNTFASIVNEPETGVSYNPQIFSIYIH